jgi:hypothetical protein
MKTEFIKKYFKLFIAFKITTFIIELIIFQAVFHNGRIFTKTSKQDDKIANSTNYKSSLDIAISEAILKYCVLPNESNEKVFEAHKILSTDEKNNLSYIFLYKECDVFSLQNNIFKCKLHEAGAVVLILEKINSKEYKFIRFVKASDNIEKEVFPQKYLDAIETYEKSGGIERLKNNIILQAKKWIDTEEMKNVVIEK